jgi:hypothetical protein
MSSMPVQIAAEAAVWRTAGEGCGLYLAFAGPQMRLPWQVLDDLIRCMPLFPVALVSSNFTACPEGHYEPGDGSVGAILRFRMLDGDRRLVYRIVRSDRPTMTYECAWPD